MEHHVGGCVSGEKGYNTYPQERDGVTITNGSLIEEHEPCQDAGTVLSERNNAQLLGVDQGQTVSKENDFRNPAASRGEANLSASVPSTPVLRKPVCIGTMPRTVGSDRRYNGLSEGVQQSIRKGKTSSADTERRYKVHTLSPGLSRKDFLQLRGRNQTSTEGLVHTNSHQTRETTRKMDTFDQERTVRTALVGKLIKKMSLKRTRSSQQLGPDAHDALPRVHEEQQTTLRTAISQVVRHLLRKRKVTDVSALLTGKNVINRELQVVVSDNSAADDKLASKVVGQWRMKSASNAICTLAPFIPRLFIDGLKELQPTFSETVTSPLLAYNAVEGNMRPSMTIFHGSVVIADVTGFTKLTENLSKKGTSGVELLTKCINSFFSKVIDLVLQFEGDVIKFAGDSLIIAFYPNDAELAVSEDEGLTEATLRGLQCACQLSSTLGKVQMLPNGEVIPIINTDCNRWGRQKKYLHTARAFRTAVNHRASAADVEAKGGSDKTRKFQNIFLSMARNTISTAVLDESPSEESSGTQKATRHKSVVRRISSMMTPANSNISYISAAGPGALSDVGCRNDSGLPLSSNHIPESSSFTEGGPATLSSYKFQNQQTDPLEQEECTAVLQKQRQSTPPVRSVRPILLTSQNDDLDRKIHRNLATQFIPSDQQTRSTDSLGVRSRFPPSAINDGSKIRELLMKPQTCARPVGEGFEAPATKCKSAIFQRAKVTCEIASTIDGAVGKGACIPSFAHGQKLVAPTQDRNGIIRKLLLRWTTRPSTGHKEPDRHSSVLTIGSWSRLGHSITNRRVSSDPKGSPGFSDEKSGGVVDQDSFVNCTLSLKVLVSSGAVCVFRVGGHEEDSRKRLNGSQGIKRWEFLIGDMPHAVPDKRHNKTQPLQQIAAVEEHANPGDVIVSKEVIEAVGQHFEYQTVDDGVFRILHVKGNTAPLLSEDSLKSQPLNFDRMLSVLPQPSQLQCAAIMRMHVIDNVRQRIEAGHMDFVNEIRRLSILFLGFPGLSEPREDCKPDDGLQSVQEAVKNVQMAMLELDGSFLQFRCDEKGFLAICAFGLPGKAHVDDCQRAVSAALRISRSLQDVGHHVVVGVTTGDLLCACVGSSTRAEYTVFGDAINLSARLMCKGKTGMGDILCDHATYERAKRKARFTALKPLVVKGKVEPVLVYSVHPVLSQKHRRNRIKSTAEKRNEFKPMIGRQDELESIFLEVVNFRRFGKTKVIIVEGDPGSGKTKLVNEVQRLNTESSKLEGIQQFHSAGDAAYKSLPLYPWRRIFEDIFTHDRMCSMRCNEGERLEFDYQSSMPQNESSSSITSLGSRLALRIDGYESAWRYFLSRTLELPLDMIPIGDASVGDSLASETETPSSYPLVALASFILTVRDFSLFPSKRCGRERLLRIHSHAEPGTTASLGKDVNNTVGPVVSIENEWVSPRSNSLDIDRKHAILKSARKQNRTEMSSNLKSKKLLDVLVEVCHSFIQLYGPIVIIVEDLHHFDTMSWRFLNRLLEELKSSCFLVGTLRGNDGSLAPHAQAMQGKCMVYEKALASYKQLREALTTSFVRLAGLNVHETRSLMVMVANCTEISDEIVQAVHEKTGGVPMYIEQMAIYLRQKKMLSSKSRAGTALNPETGLADFIRNTVTVHHVLIEQMDLLRPNTHLTLKVAAVLGNEITLSDLSSMYPYKTSSTALERDLTDLENFGFLRRTSEKDMTKTWHFNTQVARDVVHELIPHYQRRSLHAELAQALSDNRKKVPSTALAYHWTQSCIGAEATEWKRALCAIDWWEKASYEAVEKAAKVEALRLFQKAADIADKISSEATQDISTLSMVGLLSSETESTASKKLPLRSSKMSSTSYVSHGSSTTGTPAPFLSSARRARWEIEMARLCLEVATDSSSPEESRTYDDSAMGHIRAGISVVGLPLLGEDDSNQIAEISLCCCLAREKSIPDNKQGVRRRRPSWNTKVRCCMGLANGTNAPNRLLSNDEIQEVKAILELLLQVKHNKNVALEQWALLFGCFTEVSIGGAEPFQRFQRSYQAASRKPCTKTVVNCDPGLIQKGSKTQKQEVA